MIRLTDEEIDKLWLEDSRDWGKNAAKAQLKKVVEWLASRVSQNWDEGSQQPFGYTIGGKDWQALLEEVKE